MSRPLGDRLPAALAARLSPAAAIAGAHVAIIICSVDEQGLPHPAMLSPLELAARDASVLALAVHAASRTARNLNTRAVVTLVLADEEGVFYIKGRATLLSASMAASPELAAFQVRVESVLEDRAGQDEQARITTGIRVERAAIDVPRVAAVLAELVGA